MSDRCGRPKRNGKPCTSYVGAVVLTKLPACRTHLTPDERAGAAEMEKAYEAGLEQIRTVGWPPACWSWLITDTDREAVARDGSTALLRWQSGRCGICGTDLEDLVLDHDHDTSLIRGGLCRGCNTMEAVNPAAVYRYWRERPAAALFALLERYVDPMTGRYAEPLERYDRSSRWASPASGQLGL